MYIITYSNADTDAFDHHSFAHAVVAAFEENTTSKVLQLAWCMESHKEGGFHFHMCILLHRCQCWLTVKNAIKDTYGIVVHFSGHSGYHTAYEYVTKEDCHCVKSPHHPENVIAPKTLTATKKNARRAQGGQKKLRK